MNIEISEGDWSKEGDLVVYTKRLSKTDYRIVYQKKTLEEVLERIRNNREDYVTEEAWQKSISHLKEGLSLYENR